MSNIIQDSFSRTVNILEHFQTGDDNLRIIYQPSATYPFDAVQSLNYYGFLTSFRMRVDINSLTEGVLPQLNFEDTESERLAKIRDYEWTSPRKQINFFMKNPRTPWIPLFEVSLLNRLPYYQVNLISYLTDNLSFDFANDTILGAQIVDAGFGVLEGYDTVTLYGSVREEVTTLPTDRKYITASNSYNWQLSNTSQVILPANPNRLQATLVNNSANDVFLNYGSTAVVNQGITLVKNGGSYEINLTNPYYGVISAISNGTAQLTGIEAV